MARYPSPADVNWSKGIGEAPTYMNTVDHGMTLGLMALVFGVIVASGFWFTKRDFWGAFAVGSFTTWILCLIMWLGNWMSGFIFGISCAFLILGFVSLFFPRNE